MRSTVDAGPLEPNSVWQGTHAVVSRATLQSRIVHAYTCCTLTPPTYNNQEPNAETVNVE